MRLLVVEDDEVISARLKLGLERAGHQVDVAHDGDLGLAYAQEYAYAVIILDLMLPGRDGWSVCEAIRRSKNVTPILMLTARDAVTDKVRGLQLGADDYLPKPFDFRELVARIEALSRRDKLNKSHIIEVADVLIDTKAKQVTRAGEIVHLTPREYALLEALARNEGRALSREIIVEQIWNDDESLSNTVNFHVVSLRRKIDEGREHGLIRTIHGVGYMLKSVGNGSEQE